MLPRVLRAYLEAFRGIAFGLLSILLQKSWKIVDFENHPKLAFKISYKGLKNLQKWTIEVIFAFS